MSCLFCRCLHSVQNCCLDYCLLPNRQSIHKELDSTNMAFFLWVGVLVLQKSSSTGQHTGG